MRTVSVFGVIRSQAVQDRKPTVQENIYSYEARNFVALTLDRHLDPDLFRDHAVKKFFDKCVNSEVLQGLNEFPIVTNHLHFQEWLRKRDGSALSKLDKEVGYITTWRDYMCLFKLMVKKEAKVKLDASSLAKHNPAQNIIFHIKFINAVFSSIFAQLSERLRVVLKRNIILYTSMSVDKFADRLYDVLGGVNVYNTVEMDFSKFDKSQDVYIKACEMEIYRRLGLSEDMLDLWCAAETFCKAKSLDKDISFTLGAQRRSGTANTFLGNSIVTLLLLSQYYDIGDISCLAVAGDDSIMFAAADAVFSCCDISPKFGGGTHDIIFARAKPIPDFSHELMVDLGMETKLFRDLPAYFCSKFIIFCNERVYVIPDPYKLMVKLGKPYNDWDDTALSERFISFKDHTKHLDNEGVVAALTEAVNIRYNLVGYHTYAAISALHCVSANKKRFFELYPFKHGFLTRSVRKVGRMISKFTYYIKSKGFVIIDKRDQGDTYAFDYAYRETYEARNNPDVFGRSI
nr:MAG: putative 58 kDa protein [Actinidia virus 1]UIW14070.1 MAG: putative 58 kDa protein [Actinidia virus 1]